MKEIIKTIIEFIYDPELLPLNKNNAANYITLAGVWLSRLSLYMFMMILVWFFAFDTIPYTLRYIAIGMAILASGLDALDGIVARKFNCVTELGKIFDPHHDKNQYNCKTISILIDSILFAFLAINTTGETFFPHYIFLSLLVIYFTHERDEAIMFHRLWAQTEKTNVNLQAKWSGKWRTRICFGGFPLLHLLIYPGQHIIFFYLVAFLMIGITLISNYQYVKEYRQVIKNNQ